MIRSATSADALAIAGIWNTVIRTSSATFTTVEKSSDGILAEIATRPGFLVLEQQGCVAGFACLGPFRAGPGYAHLAEHTVHLAPDARGHGQGLVLMEALETLARKQGLAALIAGISGSNTGALRFHVRLGFAEVGRVPRAGRKAGAWHDLVLMHKFL